MSTRVASSGSPPSATAVTPTPTTASEVPITATYPEPKRPIRSACNVVVSPQIAIAANRIHEEVGIAAAGSAHHDHRDHHDPRNDEKGVLRAETGSDRYRGAIVGLVANALALTGAGSAHDPTLWRSTSGRSQACVPWAGRRQCTCRRAWTTAAPMVSAATCRFCASLRHERWRPTSPAPSAPVLFSAFFTGEVLRPGRWSCSEDPSPMEWTPPLPTASN